MRQLLMIFAVFFSCAGTFAQESPPIDPFENDAPEPENSDTSYEMQNYLRPRNHNLYWNISSLNVVVDNEDTQRGSTSFTYGRNFGYFEPFFSYGYSSRTSDDSVSETRIFAFGGRVNFIENVPGSDFIPYATAALAIYKERTEDLATDIDANGTPFSLSVGLLWYPFGEIFAVDVALGSISGNFDVDVDDVSDDMNMTINGLTAGFVLSF